ncbi:MAG: oligopeptide/dipeptide ABC transporter ATP-binding protein [Microbacterium sp.]
MSDDVIVKVRGLNKQYRVRGAGGISRDVVHAVSDVDLDIRRGETLGLVGESGCGKTTLSRMIVRLLNPTSGSIEFDGTDVSFLRGSRLKQFRRRAQIVFQDPYASLDPRAKVGESMAESLLHHGVGDRAERRRRVAEMLEMVGLQPAHADRYPHEFSGGQRQRIGIGRALILKPDLLVADEPVSALDVSVQAQILNLLRDLQQELNLTVLFVAHNLAVVENVSDRVAVMYLGRVVEMADRAEIFRNPQHPYTETLLRAVPAAHPRDRRTVRLNIGEVPSPLHPPVGCTFHPRCALARPGLCDQDPPTLMPIGGADAHLAACYVRAGEPAPVGSHDD